MDKLIQNADFSHDDDDKLSAYNDKVNDWKSENEENATGAQLLSALQVLNKRLTKGKCPKYDTRGWQQAVDIYDDLICRVGSELIDNEKLQVKDMRSAYYNLYLDWLKNGQSTVHLEIMEQSFSDSDIDMGDYMQKLTGESRKQLIAAMRTPIVKNEDTDDDAFYEAHRKGMDRFIGCAIDKSLLSGADLLKLWLDYSFHLYLDYLDVSESGLYHLVREADDRFSEIEDAWEAFPDVRVIKALIEKVTKATKTPGFPKTAKAAKVVCEPIDKLYRKLKRPGDAETYSDSMFDLLESVSASKGEKKNVLEVFDKALAFFEYQDKSILKKRIPFFKAVLPRFKALLEKLPMYILQETRFCYVIGDMLLEAYAGNKTLAADWISSVVPLLKRSCSKTLDQAYSVLSSDGIIWKEHKGVAKEIFQCFTQIQIPTGEEQETKKFADKLKLCVDYFTLGLEKSKILKEFGEGMMFMAVNFLELKLDKNNVYQMAEQIGERIEIDLKQNKGKVMEVMKRIHMLLKDDNMPWDDKWYLQRAVEDIIKSIIDPVNDGRIFDDADLKIFSAMCYTCLSKPAVEPNGTAMSAHFIIAGAILEKLLEWMASTKRLGYAIRLIPLLLTKYSEEDDEAVSRLSCKYLNDFATGEVATMTPHLDQLIKLYLEKDDVSILNPINTTYPFNPAPMKEHFQVMIQQLFNSGEPEVKSWMARIFWTASKKQPKLFTNTNVKDIITMAKDDTSNQSVLVQILLEISKRNPEGMINLIDLIMDRKGWDPMMSPAISDILTTLALHDKSLASNVISHCMTTIKSNPHDKAVMLTALNSIRLIGFKYSDVIKPQRGEIDSLPITDADGQSLKQTVLDVIDGKTPDNLRKQMTEQQTALSGLVGRVEEVEVMVVAVKDDLDSQGEELNNVKNEVNQQGQRLDQVEETVEETVAKVEEIDGKTLSHAPYWSRDISKLLNPATEHDWRLLSSRLGYSNADIRGWAQQADPCMAMLNEWYATRKTSEASYAILTNLQEMDRMDAAMIVENAMKKAEAVVEDEEFEYASPPEIFISYQWGHQEEVKLLHRHLGMAGYDCWMDIGQMGGGDKLFEKIDTGMRAAKLVISCVTNKYAKSPNCNREINLAVGVKKPVIPLLLESCSWPPPGSMGPIFSESLYIQFFQTGNDSTDDDRFWPVEKFQELLMQLSVNGLVPDEGKIDKVYRNWWIPLEEKINIDKSKTRDGGKQVTEVAKTGDSSESEESPEVFISYQWGKQKNIIKLYQRLTSLGFSCWLDIKQMGGGDSLYDKIDRGIRGSKVVLSCVTSKYALSPNCRREVSLCDALKKPMLPLLLEEMTWPPSGPMSMIMTQLLYIGFQQESQHTNWNGPQFDELTGKINKHLGRPLTLTGPATPATKEPSKTQKVEESKPKPQSKAVPPKTNPNKTKEEDTSSRFMPKPPPSNPKQPADGAASNDKPVPKHEPEPETEPAQSNKPEQSSQAAAPPQNPPPKSKSCNVL